MVFALRVTPPQLLTPPELLMGTALDFDSGVRACLSVYAQGLSLLKAAARCAACCSCCCCCCCCCLACVSQCSAALLPGSCPLLHQCMAPRCHSHPFSTNTFCLPTISRFQCRSVRQQLLSQALDRAVVEQPRVGREACRANLQLQRQTRALARGFTPCPARHKGWT